jgi:hypothetical protein
MGTRTFRVAVLVCVMSAPAGAQTSRVALDAVVAGDIDHGSQVSRKATGWFDLFGALRIAENLDVRARPVVFRRSFDGTWQAQMYELALRYERSGRIGWRLDAGQFTSPIGLSILENRPDKNPIVSQHSTLYLPIPFYEGGTPSTNLLAAAYPLGVKLTMSGAKWDARAAVIDSSPVRGRPFFGDNKPPRMANVVAGIGFTPYIGLRVGAAYGAGATPPRARCATGRVAIAAPRSRNSRRSGRSATHASPASSCGPHASWRDQRRASMADGSR